MLRTINPVQPLAHQSWFTDERPAYTLDFLLQPSTLALVVLAFGAALVWRSLGQRLPQPEIRMLERIGGLAPWVPRLLAIHAGVSLIAQAYDGTYLAPGLELPSTFAGSALAITEGALGVWLVSGWKIRPAAWVVVAAGPLGMLQYGVIPILERVDLLGVALFLAILAPGPDRHGAAETHPERVRQAVFGMKLLVGGSLIVLAFTEKLLRPEMALTLIDQFPALNVAELIGLNVSDLDFVRFAGAVELGFGILIISGALPQITMLAAGIPFNATLFFFGASELIGHLPLYGAMLAMLVYGSTSRLALTVSWLPARVGSRSLNASNSADGFTHFSVDG